MLKVFVLPEKYYRECKGGVDLFRQVHLVQVVCEVLVPALYVLHLLRSSTGRARTPRAKQVLLGTTKLPDSEKQKPPTNFGSTLSEQAPAPGPENEDLASSGRSTKVTGLSRENVTLVLVSQALASV